MGQNMENTGDHTHFRTQTKAHIDIADLRYGRKGDHSADILFPDGTDGTENHAAQAKQEQNVQNMAAGDITETNNPVEDLDQQEDVALGNQTGQNGTGGNCGITVGIRQPGMEGKQCTLNSQPHRHNTDGHDHGNPESTSLHDGGDLLFDIGHQQMTGHIIEHANTQQQQTGTQQAHNHISDRCFNAAAILPDHDQTCCSNGIDLHKHIGGEQVVGINQRQQGAQQQIAQDIVDVVLAVFHFTLQLFSAAQQTQQHDNAEKQRHSCFQDTHPEFIAPGCGEMAHHVGIAANAGVRHKVQQPTRHNPHDQDHGSI